jgi:hypothetical protein
MAAFIASDPQLKKAVNSKDWKTIARLYNGPGYRVNKYDTELERIYKAQAARAASRFMGAAVPDMPLPPAQERLYALGKNVVAFQEQRGLKVDGIFGKITEAEFLKYEQELREAKPRAPAMAVATAGTTGLGLFGTIAAQTQTVQDTLTPITSSLQGITVNADKVIAIVTASLVLAAIGVAIYKWARS